MPWNVTIWLQSLRSKQKLTKMWDNFRKNCLKLRTNFRKFSPHVHKFSVMFRHLWILSLPHDRTRSGGEMYRTGHIRLHPSPAHNWGYRLNLWRQHSTGAFHECQVRAFHHCAPEWQKISYNFYKFSAQWQTLRRWRNLTAPSSKFRTTSSRIT